MRWLSTWFSGQYPCTYYMGHIFWRSRLFIYLDFGPQQQTGKWNSRDCRQDWRSQRAGAGWHYHLGADGLHAFQRENVGNLSPRQKMVEARRWVLLHFFDILFSLVSIHRLKWRKEIPWPVEVVLIIWSIDDASIKPLGFISPIRVGPSANLSITSSKSIHPSRRRKFNFRWRGPPDSSVSSRILVGWCEEGHSRHQKLAPTFPGIDSCLWWLNGIFSKWKRHYD